MIYCSELWNIHNLSILPHSFFSFKFSYCVIPFSFDYIQKYYVNTFANDASELQGKSTSQAIIPCMKLNTQVNKHWWCIAMQHCLHIQWLTVTVDSGSLNKNISNLEDFGNVVVFVFINVWSCITGIPECFCLEISKVNIALTCRYMKKKLFIYTEYIYLYLQLKSKVYMHLAESAKCWLFYQVRGIIQNACYCVFSTDLNKIFHIKDVYM